MEEYLNQRDNSHKSMNRSKIAKELPLMPHEGKLIIKYPVSILNFIMS